MSVNCIGSFGIFTQNILSEETKRKLKALGIDPRGVTSESQALIIIQDALKKQALTESQRLETKMISESESETNQNSDAVFNMMNMTANVNRFILGL